MSKGKILITGVGGCGSSFLWGLLGDLGFDTGEINEVMRHPPIKRAVDRGEDVEFPEVIKNLGGFLTNLNGHIDRHNWEVRHIFLAMASHELQIKAYVKRRRYKQEGLSKEERIALAEHDYRQGLGKGLIQIVERDHSFTIIRCPRSIKDSKYCYEKLKGVLKDTVYEEFAKVHAARIVPRYLKRLEKWD